MIIEISSEKEELSKKEIPFFLKNHNCLIESIINDIKLGVVYKITQTERVFTFDSFYITIKQFGTSFCFERNMFGIRRIYMIHGGQNTYSKLNVSIINLWKLKRAINGYFKQKLQLELNKLKINK